MHLFCQGYAKEGPMRVTKVLSKVTICLTAANFDTNFHVYDL